MNVKLIPFEQQNACARLVFAQSYVEVRQMLEANLLRRFLHTKEFEVARTQRENVQTMQDSPQQVVATAV